MRHLCLIPLVLAASPGYAHIGHLGEVAGHGHLIGAGAIGLAIFIGLFGKKGKTPQADPNEAESERDGEEQPA